MVGTEQGKEEKKKKMKSTFISHFNFLIGRQQQCVCLQQDQQIKKSFQIVLQTNVQAMCLPATERQKQQQKELSDVTGVQRFILIAD